MAKPNKLPDDENTHHTPGNKVVRHVRPVPARLEDWQRKLKTKRTLNDMAEDLHMGLVVDPEYLAWLDATSDAEAKEGSTKIDDVFAAKMIRDKAQALGISAVADETLAAVKDALGVVLRRYGQSRKQRRNTLGGGFPPENDSI